MLVRVTVRLRVHARIAIPPAIGASLIALHATNSLQLPPETVALLVTSVGLLMERLGAASRHRKDETPLMQSTSTTPPVWERTDEANEPGFYGDCGGMGLKIEERVRMTPEGPVVTSRHVSRCPTD